jgi:alpha-glucoside transport system substrate-binding protein
MKSIVFGEIIMKKIKMKKRFGFIGTLMVAIVALTGVAHADSHLKFPIGEGGFNWDSYHAFAKAHDYSGQQLTVFGAMTGRQEDKMTAMFAYFEEATGADVRYTGSQNFSQEVMVDAEAGASANITAFPLPGFAMDMAKRGFLTKLDPDIAGYTRDNFAAGQSWVDLGTYAGPDGKKAYYGVPTHMYIKSVVWYVPENFEDAGYEIPQTMEELKALADRIVADGGTPWCIGLFSEGATGFPGSDWMEDLLLRSHPPELYDQWVSNEVPFDDPRIVAALEEMGERLRNEKYVAGGPSNVATQDWRVAANGILTNPPQCYLYQEGTYIPTLFPEDKKYGDWDFFYFPTRANRPDLAKYPVNGGGAFFTITKDSPAARGLLEWLKTPIAAELMMAQGGFLTPHKHVNKELFIDAATAKMNEILMNGDPFRFDPGDVFPAAVGGVCWNRMMVDFVGGKPAADVLRVCQEVWDKLK